MPPRVDFGSFKTTPATIWRPRRKESKRFDPKYVVTRAAHADMRAVERADKELEDYRPDDALSRRILHDALARNAFGTASIEGNPLTLTDVESLMAAAPTPGSVTVADEREILNYVKFTNELDAIPIPRTTQDVKDVHKALFERVLKERGRFKTQPNFVGRRETREVVFVPTMPEDVERELAAALAWLNQSHEHPLVRASVFFHEFQSIHPFHDGNGRLGRALTTLILWREGYKGIRYAPVDYALNEDRDAYYAKLDEARHGHRGKWDLTPWVSYMSGILRRSFESGARRFLFREELPRALNERQVRVAEWLARLDQGNPGRRVKFNDVHSGFPQVARRTLQLDLSILVETGIIKKDGERKGTTYRLAGPRKQNA